MSRKSSLNHALALLAVLPLLPSLAGCGAMFGGTRETIYLQSAPSGTSVRTEPVTNTVTTPSSISLERKNSYRLTFSKEGYEPAELQIHNQLRGGIVALDILFTGLIGIAVDAATGAWYKLEPKSATVSLQKKMAAIDGPEVIEIAISIDKTDEGKVVRAKANDEGVRMEVEKVEQ